MNKTTKNFALAPLNIKEALERIEDLNLLREVSKVLAKSIPSTLLSIENCLNVNEIEEATRLSHSLKSNFATVGVDDLRNIAANLELNCRNSLISAAISDLELIKSAQSQVIEALNNV